MAALSFPDERSERIPKYPYLSFRVPISRMSHGCPDCGHERLLAFTCKTRHFCPSCHQRKVRSTGDWIARVLCFDVPHRQFVFTMPKPLRGIFRKRRKLLDHLFGTAIDSLEDWMRVRSGWRL